jgi:hypothetical protein
MYSKLSSLGFLFFLPEFLAVDLKRGCKTLLALGDIFSVFLNSFKDFGRFSHPSFECIMCSNALMIFNIQSIILGLLFTRDIILLSLPLIHWIFAVSQKICCVTKFWFLTWWTTDFHYEISLILCCTRTCITIKYRLNLV